LALLKTDRKELTSFLEDIIELAEENKLMRLASRAHLARAAYMLVNSDLDITFEHSLKSAELARAIGDIEGLMFSLNQVNRKLIELGELNTADSTVVEFASQSLATDSRIDSFLIDSSMYLLYSQGDWLKAAKVGRIYIDRLRQGGKKQLIHFRNIDLTKILLELDRFNITDTLAEAELALKENFKIKWEEADNFSLMACVLARQGRVSKAQNWFEESLNAKDIDELDLLQELYRSLAKFEIAFGQEQWGQAIKSCEYSIELVKDVGYRWEWARKLIDLGDALIGRNEPGDRERARETYQQSLDMFTEMGAPGYIQVLEERLKEL
jgi:tetratricopeptide (TPR) repeat protein